MGQELILQRIDRNFDVSVSFPASLNVTPSDDLITFDFSKATSPTGSVSAFSAGLWSSLTSSGILTISANILDFNYWQKCCCWWPISIRLPISKCRGFTGPGKGVAHDNTNFLFISLLCVEENSLSKFLVQAPWQLSFCQVSVWKYLYDQSYGSSPPMWMSTLTLLEVVVVTSAIAWGPLLSFVCRLHGGFYIQSFRGRTFGRTFGRKQFHSVSHFCVWN